MNPTMLQTFEQSLLRCVACPDFLDRFYDRFLASSPKVAEKFEGTDFDRQKVVVKASLFKILRSAEEGEPEGPHRHLDSIAHRHSVDELDIGAELYDIWLDSLLETVADCDPDFGPREEAAWEQVMGVGIRYLCSRYHSG